MAFGTAGVLGVPGSSYPGGRDELLEQPSVEGWENEGKTDAEERMKEVVPGGRMEED